MITKLSGAMFMIFVLISAPFFTIQTEQDGLNRVLTDSFSTKSTFIEDIETSYFLELDGVNDSVQISYNSILLPDLSFTIHSKIKINELLSFNSSSRQNKDSVILFGNFNLDASTINDNFEFRLYKNDGVDSYNNVKFGIADQILESNIIENSIVDITAVQTSTQISYYLNGQLIGSFSNSSNYLQNNAPFYLGVDREGFHSAIEYYEFSYWDYSMTSTQINNLIDTGLTNFNKTGLLIGYNFNEGSGITLNDLGSNNFDGTINGSTWGTYGVTTLIPQSGLNYYQIMENARIADYANVDSFTNIFYTIPAMASGVAEAYNRFINFTDNLNPFRVRDELTGEFRDQTPSEVMDSWPARIIVWFRRFTD
jgi:hypothetical protein